MSHLDDTQIKRMILKETTGDALRTRELHLETCARCRVAVEDARLLWEALGAGDPARSLEDRPLWPGLVRAMDSASGRRGVFGRREASAPGARRAAVRAGRARVPGGVPLVSRWRLALGEAVHQPVAMAALLAAVVGILAGNVMGNVLLGLPPQATSNEAYASRLEASFLSGPADGSLSAAYLDGYLSETGFPDDKGAATDQADPLEGASPEAPHTGNPDSSKGGPDSPAGASGGDQ